MYGWIYISYISHIYISYISHIYIYISYIYRPVANGGGGEDPPCPIKIISILPKLKSMSFDAML